MKFAERALIMLGLIGCYFALWKKPADLSILFVAAGFLSLLYVLFMNLLLSDVSARIFFGKEHRSSIRPIKLLLGFLFGVVNAYCLFSLIYHRLREMTSLAIAENCGTFLLIFASVGLVYFRKTKSDFYKQMLIRTGVWAGLIVLSLVFRP